MFERPLVTEIRRRLKEPRRFLQALLGPRQVGKTTLARQVAGSFKGEVHSASADTAVVADAAWIEQHWEAARAMVQRSKSPGLLILDEVQKIAQWSVAVKALWDADTAAGLNLRVMVLGSSAALMQQGLTESLAGRFEVVRVPHWSFTEVREAFGMTLEEFIYFGGYPGAVPLIGEESRWRAYINDSLIETTVSRDILLMTRVDKPALLRRLFGLACEYSGQILSYQKMLGQLRDAGNTTTLAHYLDLLQGAGFVAGLQKFAGQTVRQRSSSPKLQVFNTGLISATRPMSFARAKADHAYWGRLVESAVGAHLLNLLTPVGASLHYWNCGTLEVDFVVKTEDRLLGIEVKSQPRHGAVPGMHAFKGEHPQATPVLVGGDGIPLEAFLLAWSPLR
jgi:predicted AAA+ superfamily ATPase